MGPLRIVRGRVRWTGRKAIDRYGLQLRARPDGRYPVYRGRRIGHLCQESERGKRVCLKRLAARNSNRAYRRRKRDMCSSRPNEKKVHRDGARRRLHGNGRERGPGVRFKERHRNRPMSCCLRKKSTFRHLEGCPNSNRRADFFKKRDTKVTQAVILTCRECRSYRCVPDQTKIKSATCPKCGLGKMIVTNPKSNESIDVWAP